MPGVRMAAATYLSAGSLFFLCLKPEAVRIPIRRRSVAGSGA